MTTPPADLDRQREQLLELMSAVSEQRYAAGWAHGLDQRLHTEGGIWETIGRHTGWPVGNYNAWTWMPWDETERHYAAPPKPNTTRNHPEPR